MVYSNGILERTTLTTSTNKVLARLLKLNTERTEEERLAGTVVAELGEAYLTNPNCAEKTKIVFDVELLQLQENTI